MGDHQQDYLQYYKHMYNNKPFAKLRQEGTRERMREVGGGGGERGRTVVRVHAYDKWMCVRVSPS